MAAISRHLSSHASKLAHTQMRLKSSPACMLGANKDGCGDHGFKSVDDFSKMTTEAVTVYTQFYNELCDLERKYRAKLDARNKKAKSILAEVTKDDMKFKEKEKEVTGACKRF